MSISDAVTTVFSKYATFAERAGRSEFWLWILAYIISLLVAGTIDGAIVAPLLGFEIFEQGAGQPLSLILVLGLFLPNIAVAVRRLHDINRSGWWLLVVLVPFIGALILIYWYAQPSQIGTNRYGESV